MSEKIHQVLAVLAGPQVLFSLVALSAVCARAALLRARLSLTPLFSARHCGSCSVLTVQRIHSIKVVKTVFGCRVVCCFCVSWAVSSPCRCLRLRLRRLPSLRFASSFRPSLSSSSFLAFRPFSFCTLFGPQKECKNFLHITQPFPHSFSTCYQVISRKL